MYKNEIKSFRGKYDFLSNFYPCAIIHDGFEYKSLEAAFQAAKCDNLSERLKFQCLKPEEAKKLGKKIILRSDWETKKLFILRELIKLKFIGNPDLLNRLLETGDAMLIENNIWHDNFYGNCTCNRCQNITGFNYLGAALMQLRDQLLHNINCFNEKTKF